MSKLDFSRVVARLAASRFIVTDVFSREPQRGDGGVAVCEYVRVSSRDFGYTCMIHFPGEFEMANVAENVPPEAHSWTFHDLSPDTIYVPMESINAQSALVDEKDRSEFAVSIRRAYEMSGTGGKSVDDENAVYINDVLRQLKRMRTVCEDHGFFLATTRSSYMIVLDAHGARAVYTRRAANSAGAGIGAGEAGAPVPAAPAKLFCVDPVISIRDIYTALETISDKLPRFEAALRSICDKTITIFSKNVNEYFPKGAESFQSAVSEKREREKMYDTAEADVQLFVARRAALIDALGSAETALRAASAKETTAVKSDTTKLDAAVRVARAEYDAHTAQRPALLDRHARVRQRFFSWMFMMDRAVFDNVMFMEAVKRNFARLSSKK